MNGLVAPLIALALVAAIQPAQITALLLLLQTKRGKTSALAFILGMTVFRLVLGAIFWVVFSNVEAAVESTGSQFSVLVGAVLMTLGLIMLVHALHRFFSAHDGELPASSWLNTLQEMTPPRAALLGIAFLALDPKDWITDMAAVNLIADADLSGTASLVAFLLYLLLAQSLLLLPLFMILIAPQLAYRSLGSLSNWIETHARAIDISVMAIFGALFLSLGLQQLGLF
jgi:hypothetical protein